MKVHNNQSYFMGNELINEDKQQNVNRKERGNTSYMMKQTDPITLKREQAKKKAMGIIGDAYAADKKIDEGLDKRRELIDKLKEDVSDNQNMVNSIEADREALRISSGVSAENEEERELNLLVKEAESKFKGSDIELSDDERKEIETIKERGLTEYQTRSLAMKEDEKYYADAVYDAKRQIGMESSAIRKTENERLKSHAMIDAHKEADSIMKQAAKEAVLMAVDEAKDKLDMEAEEKKDAAKEKKEDEEELEERIEARRNEKKETERRNDDISNVQENLLDSSVKVEDAQQEIKDMMNKMKLVAEDIKGAAVDEQL